MKKALLFLFMAVMVLSIRGFAQNNCTAPTGLTASLHSPEWNNVLLHWNAVTDSTQASIMWSTTTLYTRIGTNGGADFIGTVRFTPTELANYAGRYLTSVTFIPGTAEDVAITTYSIVVWQGGSITNDTVYNPGTMIVNQPITTPLSPSALNTILLDTAQLIDVTQELWIGIRCVYDTTCHPLGASNNGGVIGKGSLIVMTTNGMISPRCPTWPTTTGLSSAICKKPPTSFLVTIFTAMTLFSPPSEPPLIWIPCPMATTRTA